MPPTKNKGCIVEKLPSPALGRTSGLGSSQDLKGQQTDLQEGIFCAMHDTSDAVWC